MAIHHPFLTENLILTSGDLHYEVNLCPATVPTFSGC